MTNQDILIQIESIFQTVLKRDGIQLTEAMTSNDVDGWNSLAHMMIIADIEKHFSVRFSFREVMKLKNVGDLCEAIRNKKE